MRWNSYNAASIRSKIISSRRTVWAQIISYLHTLKPINTVAFYLDSLKIKNVWTMLNLFPDLILSNRVVLIIYSGMRKEAGSETKCWAMTTNRLWCRVSKLVETPLLWIWDRTVFQLVPTVCPHFGACASIADCVLKGTFGIFQSELFFHAVVPEWRMETTAFGAGPVLSEGTAADSGKSGCGVIAWGNCAPSVHVHWGCLFCRWQAQIVSVWRLVEGIPTEIELYAEV